MAFFYKGAREQSQRRCFLCFSFVFACNGLVGGGFSFLYCNYCLVVFCVSGVLSG